jgi:hypothetical protein
MTTIDPPSPHQLRRRAFLARVIAGVALTAVPGCQTNPSASKSKPFATKGVVLIPSDLSLADWPERASRAGLNTIALHHSSSPQVVVRFIQSGPGQKFLEQCEQLDLEVEYELHAIKELLPRELFAQDPSLFRMDEKGQHTPDANCCVHSSHALEIIGEKAVSLSQVLRPTTGRYFLWGDDGRPWCRCPKCNGLSDPDQALVLENHLLKSLRRVDRRATLAHLSYAKTLTAPSQVKPERGIFLEYAPIKRRYDIPYSQQSQPGDADSLASLDANLKVFPRHTAQVLEYWLDVSRFSHWNRPAVKLPWNRDVFLADLDTYAARGIRNVTSFAVWIDADYTNQDAELRFIAEYGAGLSGQRE